MNPVTKDLKTGLCGKICFICISLYAIIEKLKRERKKEKEGVSEMDRVGERRGEREKERKKEMRRQSQQDR